MIEREYLTAAETAKLLRVHRATVYRAVEAGRLPVVRLDEHGAIRSPVSAIHKREEKPE